MPEHYDNAVHSTPLPLYKARVVSVDDPNEKGRVRIRVLPQFKDVDQTLLPWAEPLIARGMDPEEFSFDPPEPGAMVWCVFTDTQWKDPYWVPGYFLSGFFDYGNVKSTLDGITELSDTDYPNIRFHLLPQGNITFYNAANGEMGTIHNSGGYVVFDSEGTLILKSEGEVRIQGGEDYAVRFNELLDAFNQLKTDFNNLVSSYNLHTHPATSGSTSPTADGQASSTNADMSSSRVDSVRFP